MASDTTSNHPFRIGRILKLSWKLVIQNISLWLCLVVVLYFLYYFLIEKIEELFISLMMSGLELSKPLWAEGLELSYGQMLCMAVSNPADFLRKWNRATGRGAWVSESDIPRVMNGKRRHVEPCMQSIKSGYETNTQPGRTSSGE